MMSTDQPCGDGVLVSTDWVAAHLDDPEVRIIESDRDSSMYDLGHVPGAALVDWKADLQDPVVRDFVGPEQFASLASRLGIDNETTAVFYGDCGNRRAAYAYWVFKLYGHASARLMDGGRQKWVMEERPLTRGVKSYPLTLYEVAGQDLSIRAFRDDVLQHVENARSFPEACALVDVRSYGEYSGELLNVPGFPQEGALRAGHIPGARNIPWVEAVGPDGTFKSVDELRTIYTSHGVTPNRKIITYCRAGERSSHTWFVLYELLGYRRVRNYDGSWLEWGNTVRVPIEL